MSIEETIAAAVERAVDRLAPKIVEASQPRLLSREQAARYLGRRPSYLDNLVDRGVIHPVRFPGAPDQKRLTPQFDVRDLDAAIEAHKTA